MRARCGDGEAVVPAYRHRSAVRPWLERGIEGREAAHPFHDGGISMSAADKADNKAEETKGQIKETAGKATGNEELQAEGETDQAKANMKQAGEKIKDIFKH
jgi:uncharacterized protein YjbJ (UPF0337 family)